RVLVREQDHVALALHDLERIRHVRRARNARHVALGLRVRRGPAGTVLLALRERLRLVWNGSADDDALPGRDRGDRPELPEVLDRLRGVALEIPVGRVHRLPYAVQIRLAGDALGAFALLRVSGRERRDRDGGTAQNGEWKSVAHALYHTPFKALRGRKEYAYLEWGGQCASESVAGRTAARRSFATSAAFGARRRVVGPGARRRALDRGRVPRSGCRLGGARGADSRCVQGSELARAPPLVGRPGPAGHL